MTWRGSASFRWLVILLALVLAGNLFIHERDRQQQSKSWKAGAIWRPLPDFPKSDKARELAIADTRARLAADPLASGELRNLVLLRRDIALDKYRNDLELAQRVSRRDVPLQIELLRVSAEMADLRGVLHHSDRLIQTSPNFSAELYKSLSAGLSEPAWRAALRGYENKAWFKGFLISALNSAPPLDLVALIVDGGRVLPSGRAILPQLQVKLVESGAIDSARNLVVRYGGLAPSTLDTMAISRQTSDPAGAPFTWAFPLLKNSSGPELYDGMAGFEIGTDKGGVLMERVTDFSPGRYAFLQTITGISDPAISAWWQGNCKGPDAPPKAFLNQPLPIRNGISNYRTIVIIPEGCTTQHWRFNVLLAEGQDNTRIVLGSLAMERLP